MSNNTNGNRPIGHNDVIVNVPEWMAFPSITKYQSMLTFGSVDKNRPYIVQLRNPLNRPSAEDIIEVEGLNMYFYETVDMSSIDLGPLRIMYSVIADALDEDYRKNNVSENRALEYSVNIHKSDLLEKMCRRGNLTKEEATVALNKIIVYTNLYGLMYRTSKDFLGKWRTYCNAYPLLSVLAIRGEDNTIQFSSPYLNMVQYKIREETQRRNPKTGTLERKKNGELIFDSSHTYLIKNSINKERNKRAIEIVIIVCVMIEQAGSRADGNNKPSISAETILDRHPELYDYVYNRAKSRTSQERALKRAFTKAWELLETQTRLKEVYKDIQLPGKDEYPTMATLNRVFTFPHKGK